MRSEWYLIKVYFNNEKLIPLSAAIFFVFCHPERSRRAFLKKQKRISATIGARARVQNSKFVGQHSTFLDLEKTKNIEQRTTNVEGIENNTHLKYKIV